MRIAQIILPETSWYERKCQEIDYTLLAAKHEVTVTSFEGAMSAGADLAHVYGTAGFTPPPPSFAIPYIAAGAPRRRPFTWRKPAAPRLITSPLIDLPEAVADAYFAAALRTPKAGAHTVGAFGPHRPGTFAMLEQTAARIQRFRDDIEWRIFEQPPTPDDLLLVDAWIDPATTDDDYDGYVAEAIAASMVVVASRTPINLKRLDKGMSGFLVPPRDPNELAHAILAALFKSEVALKKIEGARQTAGKFRPRQRLRVLEKLYATVVP